jgi:hypothetical protein
MLSVRTQNAADMVGNTSIIDPDHVEWLRQRASCENFRVVDVVCMRASATAVHNVGDTSLGVLTFKHDDEREWFTILMEEVGGSDSGAPSITLQTDKMHSDQNRSATKTLQSPTGNYLEAVLYQL